ncbi:hypothetical protein GGS23DRAFT_187266 [Durotheca rogersii]|uniref:uncharacterized protein n=1 Tax=Durotheca rogersii TaxID=419775 RepID=UPI0022205C59|nr:uncharacterized protein GGS23DRAFT_187266 [Durotheca rogersii]KAI5867655.1 hypothetical protein GGS23DRAFT_187266 [Durotheca rogersii]
MHICRIQSQAGVTAFMSRTLDHLSMVRPRPPTTMRLSCIQSISYTYTWPSWLGARLREALSTYIRPRPSYFSGIPSLFSTLFILMFEYPRHLSTQPTSSLAIAPSPPHQSSISDLDLDTYLRHPHPVLLLAKPVCIYVCACTCGPRSRMSLHRIRICDSHHCHSPMGCRAAAVPASEFQTHPVLGRKPRFAA